MKICNYWNNADVDMPEITDGDVLSAGRQLKDSTDTWVFLKEHMVVFKDGGFGLSVFCSDGHFHNKNGNREEVKWWIDVWKLLPPVPE